MSAQKFVAVESTGAGVTFIRPSDLARNGTTGTILEGTYTGSVANNLNPDKDDYAFELEDGSKVIINGTDGLSRQMAQVQLGELVQIQYMGKVPTKNNKTAHNFKVLRAINE
jgi:hypothetical protein